MESPSIVARWQSLAPQFRSLLRIAAGFTFMLAGTSKLFAFPDGKPVELMSLMGLAGILETFGGALMILGLFTRPVAFILSGEMAVAYFKAHFPESPWPTINHGVSSWLYCFVWFYFSAAGAGPWSVDALLKRNRSTNAAR